MKILLRKLRSLLAYARDPRRLMPAVRRNLAQIRAAAGGSGCFTYDSPLGVRFVCFADHATSLQLYVHGYQEAAEIAIARAWLRPGDGCVDVGANVGLLTAIFAASVGESGFVLALEPSPVTFSRLADTLRRLELSHVVPIACCASNEEGFTPFYVTSGDADAEEESMQVSPARLAEFRRAVVPCARLTSLWRAVNGSDSPALLKVDVEGAEPLVLDGGGYLIGGDSPPLVIAELHRTALANYGYGPDDVLRHLPSDRFMRFFVPRSKSDATPARRHGVVYPFQDAEVLPIYSNLIAIPTQGDRSRWESVQHQLDLYGEAGVFTHDE